MSDRRTAESDDVRSMAGRYLEGVALEGYLEFAAEHLKEERYTFRPTRWPFADLTV